VSAFDENGYIYFTSSGGSAPTCSNNPWPCAVSDPTVQCPCPVDYVNQCRPYGCALQQPPPAPPLEPTPCSESAQCTRGTAECPNDFYGACNTDVGACTHVQHECGSAAACSSYDLAGFCYFNGLSVNGTPICSAQGGYCSGVAASCPCSRPPPTPSPLPPTAAPTPAPIASCPADALCNYGTPTGDAQCTAEFGAQYGSDTCTSNNVCDSSLLSPGTPIADAVSNTKCIASVSAGDMECFECFGSVLECMDMYPGLYYLCSAALQNGGPLCYTGYVALTDPFTGYCASGPFELYACNQYCNAP
jgi:hypothetical protein